MKPESQPTRSRGALIFVGLALALVTFLIYLPAGRHPFLTIDDPDYVVRNPHVNSGLSLANAAWAFAQFHAGNWHPLTWLSHALDCQLFGLEAGAHHLVNAGFHALNAFLLLWVLVRLTGAFWPSVVVASLFALHPAHVESVAWIAERKDVLSGFFFFLTLGAYARYAEYRGSRNSKVWYGGALGLYALDLMCKPMVVTLPFVLLLLDYWPLGRIQSSEAGREPGTGHLLSTAPIIRLLLEKMPFLALSAVSCVVTLLAQQRSGAVVSTLELSLPLRLAHVLVGYVRYLILAFSPYELAIFYPLPKSIPAWQILGAAAVLIGLTTLAIVAIRKRPYLLFGWLWFLGMLVPVIGLVKAGEQAVADRYTYLPLIGIFIAVAWGIAEAARRLNRSLAFGVWCLVFPVLVLQTRNQLSYWTDTRTLCEHALRVTGNNYFASAVLGHIAWREGDLNTAKGHFLKALERAPFAPDLHTAVGSILVSQKRYLEARPHFEQALAVSPELEEACYGAALCLFHQGQLAEAEAACRRAWVLSPDDPKPPLLLALVLQQSGQSMEEAEAIYRQVLANLDPEQARADPSASAPTSRFQAIETPGRAQAHCSFAQLLASRGKPAEAIAQYRAALRCQPDLTVALNNLAWILATSPEAALRNGPESVKLAEAACRLTEDGEPIFVGTLAAAYAEVGRFDDAVRAAEKARALAQKAGLTNLVERNTVLLQSYRNQKAYHGP